MDLEPLWRVLIAAGLTLPIGLERELRGKAAGLRTHVVVAIASAALGYISITAAAGAQGNDATRIAAQVVSGIGFMGAGIIFASGGRVHGLTTAAALWSAMAVGLSAGMGGYAIATALVLVTLIFLTPVDMVAARITQRFGWEERAFYLVVDDLAAVQRAQESLAQSGAQPRQLELSALGDSMTARLLVRCRGNRIGAAYRALVTVEGVRFVSAEALLRGEG
jgi:putative Mg2+ transporter-C (MgtC) family protein